MLTPSDLIPAWSRVLSPVTNCQPLAESSFVFRITTPGGAYVLKETGTVNPGGDVERKLIADYAAWRFLAERGVPLALPIPTGDGADTLVRGGRCFSLFPELPSRPDPATPPEQLFATVGAALARLHLALAAYPGPIYSWTMDLPPRALDEAVPVIRRHRSPADAARLDSDIAQVAPHLRARLANLPSHYLHGDAHMGNILLDGGQVSGFIDMDHMPVGPRLWDVCYNLCDSARRYFEDPRQDGVFFTQILPGLFRGYERVSPFTIAEKDAAPFMMMAVQLIMAGWLFEPLGRDNWAHGNVELFHWVVQQKERIRDEIPDSPA